MEFITGGSGFSVGDIIVVNNGKEVFEARVTKVSFNQLESTVLIERKEEEMKDLKQGHSLYCTKPFYNGFQSDRFERNETYHVQRINRNQSSIKIDGTNFSQKVVSNHFKKYTYNVIGTVKPLNTLALEAQIQNEKNIAMEIMSKLPPEAVVCGGAPRNWEFNKLANDLDIYIGANRGGLLGNGKFNVRKFIEEKFLVGVTRKDNYCGELGSGLEAVIEVNEFDYRGKNIQIIKFQYEGTSNVDLCEHVTSSFDFGICKIGMLGDGSIIKKQEFEIDKTNKTLTIDQNDMLEESIPKRFKKMQEYFPDHKIVIK